MTRTAAVMSSAILPFVMGVSAFGTDVISIAKPRPLMELADALYERYGYLVTYEDAPADPAAEITVERGPNGFETRHLSWKPVAFYVNARETPDVDASGNTTAGKIKPLSPGIIEPLLDQSTPQATLGVFRSFTMASMLTSCRRSGQGKTRGLPADSQHNRTNALDVSRPSRPAGGPVRSAPRQPLE